MMLGRPFVSNAPTPASLVSIQLYVLVALRLVLSPTALAHACRNIMMMAVPFNAWIATTPARPAPTFLFAPLAMLPCLGSSTAPPSTAVAWPSTTMQASNYALAVMPVAPLASMAQHAKVAL